MLATQNHSAQMLRSGRIIERNGNSESSANSPIRQTVHFGDVPSDPLAGLSSRTVGKILELVTTLSSPRYVHLLQVLGQTTQAQRNGVIRLMRVLEQPEVLATFKEMAAIQKREEFATSRDHMRELQDFQGRHPYKEHWIKNSLLLLLIGLSKRADNPADPYGWRPVRSPVTILRSELEARLSAGQRLSTETIQGCLSSLEEIGLIAKTGPDSLAMTPLGGFMFWSGAVGLILPAKPLQEVSR